MNRSGVLDLVRGLAALLVMIGHIRSIFLPPLQELSNPGLIEKMFYFVTGFAHQCVVVFFVLSGYLVGASYHRNFNSEPISLHTKKYALNRLARLWTVLIPALLFTAFADWLGQSLTTGQTPYNTVNYYPFMDMSNDRTIGTFFGNLFFLQTIVVPTFGTDRPLWSLANEFWYYLLFPGIYLVFVKNVAAAIKAVLALASIAILYWISRDNLELLEGFAAWLLGFGVYRLKIKPGMFLRIAGVLLFVVVFAWSRFVVFTHAMLVIGLAAGALIFAIRDLQLKHLRPISDFISRISYTLYLVHVPFVVLIAATIFGNARFDGDIPGVLFVVGASIVTIAFSYGMYFLFERRTDEVRAFLNRLFFKDPLQSKSPNNFRSYKTHS